MGVLYGEGSTTDFSAMLALVNKSTQGLAGVKELSELIGVKTTWQLLIELSSYGNGLKLMKFPQNTNIYIQEKEQSMSASFVIDGPNLICRALDLGIKGDDITKYLSVNKLWNNLLKIPIT